MHYIDHNLYLKNEDERTLNVKRLLEKYGNHHPFQLLVQGNIKDAFTTFIIADKDEPYIQTMIEWLCMIYHENYDNEPIICYDKFISDKKYESYKNDFVLGYLAFNERRYDEAYSHFINVIDDPWVQLGLLKLYKSYDYYERSANHVKIEETTIQNSFNNGLYLIKYYQAGLLYNKRDENCFKCFTEFFDSPFYNYDIYDGNYETYLYQISIHYLLKNEYELSFKYFSKLLNFIVKENDSTYLLYPFAVLLFQLTKHQPEKIDFEKISYYLYAYEDTQRFEDLEYYNISKEKFLNEYEELEKVALSQNCPEGIYRKICEFIVNIFLCKKSDYNKALYYFTQAKNLVGMSTCYEALDNLEEADNCINKAIENKENGILLFAGTIYLNGARKRKKDIKKALEYFRQEFKSEPLSILEKIEIYPNNNDYKEEFIAFLRERFDERNPNYDETYMERKINGKISYLLGLFYYDTDKENSYYFLEIASSKGDKNADFLLSNLKYEKIKKCLFSLQDCLDKYNNVMSEGDYLKYSNDLKELYKYMENNNDEEISVISDVD
jgi:hypothetical protein